MKKMQTSTMQTNIINKYKTRLKHKYIVAKIQSNTQRKLEGSQRKMAHCLHKNKNSNDC